MPDNAVQVTAAHSLSGGMANLLIANNFDPYVLKPWIGNDGNSYITRFDRNGKPYSQLVTNAPATLRKDEWKQLDEALIRVAKPRLRVFGDLRAAGLEYTIPNGMSKTVLEYEDVSDITPATISMDGIRRSQADRPVFDLKFLPLPIIHKDFQFTARQLATSREKGRLDTTTAELAAMRVAEEIEKLTLGVSSSYSFGGGTVYGFTNFPNRITGSLTNPAGAGWTPATAVQEVLAMISASRAAYHYGPWVLYYSPAWDKYMNDDYSANKGDNTLAERIQRIEGINDVRVADHLTGTRFVLVQQTANVARAVVGMEMTTVQWESEGGMMLNFKVMAIMVPQLRTDQNNNTGIVDYSV